MCVNREWHRRSGLFGCASLAELLETSSRVAQRDRQAVRQAGSQEIRELAAARRGKERLCEDGGGREKRVDWEN